MRDFFVLLCFSVRIFSTSIILDVSLALEVGYALMHWSLGSYISCHEFHRTSKRCCFLQCFFKLFGSGEPTGDADYRHRMGAQLGEVPESIDVDAAAEMFFRTWDSGFHGGRIFVKNGWRNKYPSTANITWRKEIQHDTICIHLHRFPWIFWVFEFVNFPQLGCFKGRAVSMWLWKVPVDASATEFLELCDSSSHIVSHPAISHGITKCHNTIDVWKNTV